ncbi:hypothetical protein JCM10213_003506 [Rhodosporidiobolus nylandii]
MQATAAQSVNTAGCYNPYQHFPFGVYAPEQAGEASSSPALAALPVAQAPSQTGPRAPQCEWSIVLPAFQLTAIHHEVCATLFCGRDDAPHSLVFLSPTAKLTSFLLEAVPDKLADSARLQQLLKEMTDLPEGEGLCPTSQDWWAWQTAVFPGLSAGLKLQQDLLADDTTFPYYAINGNKRQRL